MKDLIPDSTKSCQNPEQDHGERNKAYEKPMRGVALCSLEKTADFSTT